MNNRMKWSAAAIVAATLPAATTGSSHALVPGEVLSQ
jgi:hypothetical protein